MSRKFVSNFVGIASPFSRRLNKTDSKVLRPLQEDGRQYLDALKETLMSPPFLFLPQKSGHYILDIDAWDKKVGCAPAQDHKLGKAHCQIILFDS